MNILTILRIDGGWSVAISDEFLALKGVTPAPVSAQAATQETQPLPPVEPRRRRASGTSAPSAEPQPAASTAETPAPVSRRRRSVTEAVAEPAANPSPVPEAAPAPTGRRRSVAAGTAATTSEITDLDLGKAASDAARKLTPKVVMQIVDEDFGVKTVAEIPQERRREFLDTLAKEVA